MGSTILKPVSDAEVFTFKYKKSIITEVVKFFALDSKSNFIIQDTVKLNESCTQMTI